MQDSLNVESGFINISSADYQGNQLLYNHLSNIEPLHLYRVAWMLWGGGGGGSS